MIAGPREARQRNTPDLGQTGMSMGFLDNLENDLKALESSEESAAGEQRERDRREIDRAAAAASAPWAEALKKGPYTQELFSQTARVGHELRTKVHVAWLGSTLRLEARDRRLELRPTPEGISAVYLEDGREVRTHALDLKGSPEDLVRAWLTSLT